ncbi:MAG: PrpR N-terminal domain-containing protein, partial [Oscillospiraceae bacterium]
MLSNLLFVATHREMYEAARRVSVERGEPLDILEGDLFDALEKVRGFDLSGKEVIVCRGGTAQLLRERCHLPVVEVEVGAYDLLRAVYPYRG